jgi:hypothetical protein
MPKAPCKTADGPDCPKRHVGCQSKCEKYREFRQAMDKIAENRQAQYLVDDYINRRVYARRKTLMLTPAGKAALAAK